MSFKNLKGKKNILGLGVGTGVFKRTCLFTYNAY